uniref:Signal transducer and activator of transcription b N-terminal domain-containing protein n=1 Tax=Globodera rostochiensis TaxID=31243 RepID=A0A914H303_GLORO
MFHNPSSVQHPTSSDYYAQQQQHHQPMDTGGGPSDSVAFSPISIHAKVSPAPSVQTPPSFVGFQLPPEFVQRHNVTAEVYQSFKDNVDALFSGQLIGGAQNEFLTRILARGEQLAMAMEAEKQYLMSEVLCNWAVHQQKLSVATQWTQQMNYSLLNSIDIQFEYFGELLEQTLSGLGYLIAEYPNFGFEQQHQQIRQLAHLFLFYSIVVSKQPPAVVVKCGEAENHRRSRFWFNTEIRMLGGKAFGLGASAKNAQVHCHLITDETAKRLRNNAYYEISDHEEFVVDPSNAFLKNVMEMGAGGGVTVGMGPVGDSGESMAMVAKFDDMRVSKKEQLRRESVAQKRYHLCYAVKLKTEKHQIELVGKKVSLPFAILVGPKADVEAKLFMERSFADFVRRPDGELPKLVNGFEMVNALEMKFQALLAIPQKSTDPVALQQPRPFAAVSRQHLLNRLKPNGNGQISVDNFLKMPAAEEFCVAKGKSNNKENGGGTPQSPPGSVGSGGAAEGEWKLVPFYEWFFKLAEMVNKYFLQMWSEGKKLNMKISVRDQYGAIRHHWYEQAELQGRSLGQELLQNSKYREIAFIWPQTNLEWAIGTRERSLSASTMAQRRPRQLQPSTLYFDNQDAGMDVHGGLRY